MSNLGFQNLQRELGSKDVAVGAAGDNVLYIVFPTEYNATQKLDVVQQILGCMKKAEDDYYAKLKRATKGCV